MGTMNRGIPAPQSKMPAAPSKFGLPTNEMRARNPMMAPSGQITRGVPPPMPMGPTPMGPLAPPMRQMQQQNVLAQLIRQR